MLSKTALITYGNGSPLNDSTRVLARESLRSTGEESGRKRGALGEPPVQEEDDLRMERG